MIKRIFNYWFKNKSDDKVCGYMSSDRKFFTSLEERDIYDKYLTLKFRISLLENTVRNLLCEFDNSHSTENWKLQEFLVHYFEKSPTALCRLLEKLQELREANIELSHEQYKNFRTDKRVENFRSNE